MSSTQNAQLQTVKAFALATVAAASLTGALSTNARAFQDEGTIILCSIEPLSGIGTSFGQPNYLGKLIAVDEINAEGGIDIGGKKMKIKLISEDDQAKPDQGVPLFRKCAESEKALVITGTQAPCAQVSHERSRRRLVDALQSSLIRFARKTLTARR